MPPSLSPRVTRSSQNLKARQTYGGRPAGFGARKLQIYKEFDEAVAENEKNRKGGGSGSERKRVVGLGKEPVRTNQANKIMTNQPLVSNDIVEAEEHSSETLIDPFQDADHVIYSDSDDNAGEDEDFKTPYTLHSPPALTSEPNRMTKPMVVIHRRTNTMTTTTRRNVGVLADKTSRTQVVSIGDYDTVVDDRLGPDHDQENRIRRVPGVGKMKRMGLVSSSGHNLNGEQQVTENENDNPEEKKSVLKRATEAVMTRTRKGARPSVITITTQKAGKTKGYRQLDDQDDDDDAYDVKDAMPQRTRIRHNDLFLDSFDPEEQEGQGEGSDTGKISLQDMLRSTGPSTKTSKPHEQKIRVRRKDVSYMLKNPDADELVLPMGQYAIKYEGPGARITRLSVDPDVDADQMGYDALGPTAPEGGIELPLEAPVATSTPRRKRLDDSKQTEKIVTGSGTLNLLKTRKVRKITKTSLVIRRSPMVRGSQRIPSRKDNNEVSGTEGGKGNHENGNAMEVELEKKKKKRSIGTTSGSDTHETRKGRSKQD